MELDCPKCGQHFSAPDEVAGRTARCGVCKTVFFVVKPEPVEDAVPEYELEQSLDTYVASRPVAPPSPPRRMPPPEIEDEGSLSSVEHAVQFVGEYLPGLFRVKVLIFSALCALAGFAVLGLSMFVFMIGAAISAFPIGAFGLICYAQALGMLLCGETMILSEALSELNSWQWILFIVLLLTPFFLVFIAVGERLAG